MAMSPPTPAELAIVVRLADITTRWETSWVEAELQHATDLMTAATSLQEYPEDEVGARLVRRGILAMAHALLVRGDDKDAEYNIFSSERLGSYSYTKAQNREPSGVADFDAAMDWVNDFLGAGLPRTESDVVFTDPIPTEDTPPWPFDWGYNASQVAQDPT